MPSISSFFKKIGNSLIRFEAHGRYNKQDEAYLAASSNLYDLERRIRELERHSAPHQMGRFN